MSSRVWIEEHWLPGRSGRPTMPFGGGRSITPETETDSREDNDSSDDDVHYHISVMDAPVKMSSQTAVGGDDSTDAYDSDATVSDPGEPEPLVRNGFTDTSYHYTDIFKKLQLKPEFYDGFIEYMKEHRRDEKVREVLANNTDQGPKDVAGEFLERYGAKVWKLKGKFCKQDRAKYGQTLFDIKSDSDRLIPILDELWLRVRTLCFILDPGPLSPSVPPERKKPALVPVAPAAPVAPAPAAPFVQPRYPAPFIMPAPADVSLDPDEEAIAVAFVNKVRMNLHRLPGNVKPRSGKK